MSETTNKAWLQTMSSRIDAITKNENQTNTESFINCFETYGPQIYPLLFGEGMICTQLGGDMDNNIQKIKRHFLEHKTEYITIEEMVKTEVQVNGKDKLYNEKDVAVKGVLWLNRTLDFICTMLEKLVNRGEKTTLDIVQETYEVTLKPFHGWIAGGVFSSALGWVSDIETLLKQFGFASEEEFKTAAKELTKKLRPIVKENYDILDKYDVHFKYSVM
eukprot:snap_masked-scaffold_50-processed-gene-1.68-mRNA-1 protein AED:1.00 eAED:1.00 QI:0/-1/0/0/-1/1/1/0/217